MKVSIQTLGCKANQAESSVLEANLVKHGWSVVEMEDRPDFCIINTCSVTSKSDYQSRQLIRRANRAGARIIVTGCYSEMNRSDVSSMEGVTNVVENTNKVNIISQLIGAPSDSALNISGGSRSRLFLKIQDGCNNSCSYCIIRVARGRSKSLDGEEVLNQVKLSSETYNEVVLTGIHLGTYGYDLQPKVKLSDLLSDILLKTSMKRIRLSSLEILEIDDQLLDLMKDPRICSHLHIPLQSGDDHILKRLNRRYSSRDFIRGIEKILLYSPAVAIGTDVIVGFPGEGNREFNNSLGILKDLPVSFIHVFPFSPRKGTSAWDMGPKVPEDIKRERSFLLRNVGERKKLEYMRKQIGRDLAIVVEETKGDKSVAGLSGNYLKVRTVHPQARPRDIVTVRIADIEHDHLSGSAIESL